MSKTNKSRNQISLSADHFQKRFDTLVPLILDQWEHLEEDTLTATKGNLDSVVDYIKHQTDQKRTIVRRQLAKLYQCAQEQENNVTSTIGSNLASNVSSTVSSLDVSNVQEQIFPTVEKTLKLIEERAESLLSRIEKDVLPTVNEGVGEKVREKVREKPGTSLVTAFGFGLFIGLILGGFGRGRE